MFQELPFDKPQYGKPQQFEKTDFIVTPSSNRIARKSTILGMSNILVAGKTTIEKGSTLRGDLERISIGKSCVIGEQVVLKPPEQRSMDEINYLAMQIGDFVIIGKSSIVRAAQ